VKDNPLTLGDHLRKARYERKLLQVDLSRMLNVNYSTIRRWEKNEVRVTPMYLKRIQEFLGYSI